MDVIATAPIVELNTNQVQVLSTICRRRATGSKSRISLARDWLSSEAASRTRRSSLATARARLASSEENYRRVIGRRPDTLAPPPPLPPLPGSPEEAVRIALASNPDLLAINRAAVAAGYDVRSARGTRLPTVSGVVSGDYVNTLTNNNFTNGLGQPEDPPNSGTQTSIGLSGRIPLYQGGLLRRASVRRRRPKPRRWSRWSAPNAPWCEHAVGFRQLQAARDAIQSNQTRSRPMNSLSKAPREQSVGTRTVLDVLNAEQELLNSQVALVTARRDAYVAVFQLLNAMGQAEAQDLGLEGGPLYDPLGKLSPRRRRLERLGGERRPGVVATRTVTPRRGVPAVAPVPAPQGVTPPRQ